MRRALILVAALLAINAALVAEAQAQPAVATIYHSQQIPINNGQLETVTVTCPPGYTATSGTTYPLPAGVSIVKSVSSGPRQIYLVQPAGHAATTVTFVVTCVKKKFLIKKKKLKIAFIYSPQITNTQTVLIKKKPTKVTVQCPTDQAPLGPQIELGVSPTPKARTSGVTADDLSFSESMPVPGGWEYTVNNDSNTDASASLGVSCGPRTVKRRFRHRRRRHTLNVLRVTQQIPYMQGSNPAFLGCSRGAPLSAGFNFASNKQKLLGAHPDQTKNGLDFLIFSSQNTPSAGTLFGLCLDGAKRSVKADQV